MKANNSRNFAAFIHRFIDDFRSFVKLFGLVVYRNSLAEHRHGQGWTPDDCANYMAAIQDWRGRFIIKFDFQDELFIEKTRIEDVSAPILFTTAVYEDLDDEPSNKDLGAISWMSIPSVFSIWAAVFVFWWGSAFFIADWSIWNIPNGAENPFRQNIDEKKRVHRILFLEA